MIFKEPRREYPVWMGDGPYTASQTQLAETPDAPTLTPSIDCQSKPCWHGFIVNGEVRP